MHEVSDWKTSEWRSRPTKEVLGFGTEFYSTGHPLNRQDKVRLVRLRRVLRQGGRLWDDGLEVVQGLHRSGSVRVSEDVVESHEGVCPGLYTPRVPDRHLVDFRNR